MQEISINNLNLQKGGFIYHNWECNINFLIPYDPGVAHKPTQGSNILLKGVKLLYTRPMKLETYNVFLKMTTI